MRLTHKQQRREWEIIGESAREIGVLLIALAPLDFGFGALSPSSASIALCFVTGGLLFFYAGIRMERVLGQAD